MSEPSSQTATVAPRASNTGHLLALAVAVAVLSLIPLLFNTNFYFYADTPEGAYGQWFELGSQLRAGHWPLMNPAAWMAGNYLAEGQWGLWNPIVLLIGLIVSLAGNAVVVCSAIKIVFLVIGALGVYLLARSFGAHRDWAFVAGLASALAGFTLFMDATSWVTNEMVWAFSAWTIWAIREFSAHRRSVLWPAITGYLLITVGYVEGTLILVLFYLAIITDGLLRRQWRVTLRVTLLGVLHGLTAVAVYLPGILTSPVTTRATGVSNSGFMVLTLTGLATSISSFTTGPLKGWWGDFATLPLLYIAWFLPLLWLTSSTGLRNLGRRFSSLWLFGFLVLCHATGPSDVGPLRFPARSLPWLALVLIVTTVVAFDRARAPRPSWLQLGLMLATVVFSTWLVLAATPQSWHWPRNMAHLALQIAGLTFAWWWCRRQGRTTPLHRAPGLSSILANRSLLPITTAVITAIVLALQAKTYAPLVQSRSDYPAQVARYEAVLPAGKGDGIIVGDALSLNSEFWDETVFGNSWYLNRVQVQNLYTPVGFARYSQDLCLLYDGRSCPKLLDALFATDPSTGVPLVDLLSLDTVQILPSDDLPLDDIRRRMPPAGWHVAQSGQQSVTWVRDSAGVPVGEAVWVSEGLQVTQVANSNLSSTVHIDAVGAAGGRLVFSRLAWPGYRVDGGQLSPDVVRGYLLTVDVPAGSAGTDVTVTFRPPGWSLEVAAVLAAGLLSLAWFGWERLGRRRLAARKRVVR